MREVVEELLGVEEKYHLCKKEIDGFQFWQYERYYIDNYLRLDGNLPGQSKDSKWNLVKYYLTKSSRLKKDKPVDICFISHPRRVLCDGQYECIYTDEVAKKFPGSVTFENFYEREHREPIMSQNVLYMDRPVIEAELYVLFWGLFAKKRKQKIADRIYGELKQPLQDLMTAEEVRKLAWRSAGDFYRYRYLHKRFKRILNCMRPKLVVEVVSYGPKCMIINEICKDMGIRTIELQHGAIGEKVLAYNYAAGDAIRQFPDKIYLFGDYYKQNIRCPLSPDCLVSIGFPYFERSIRAYMKYKRQDDRYTILFLSQGVYTRSMSDVAVALSHLTNTEKVRIIYKLHPFEYHNWQEIHPTLQDSGVEVVGEKGMPLYECFATSDAQVGVASTAVYEGLGFELRTFILKHAFSGRLQGLVEQGVAELVENADDIAEKLDVSKPIAYSVDFFWKRNALYNLEHALQMELHQAQCSDGGRISRWR